MTYQVIKVSKDCNLISQVLTTSIGTTYIIDGLNDNNAQSQTNIGDFIFLVLGGDHAKGCINRLNYNNGLKALAEVITAPTPTKPYEIEIKITYVFNNTVTKKDFYEYKDLIDVRSIGGSTKGEKTQAVSLITQTNYENIIKALIDLGQFTNPNSQVLTQYSISNNDLEKYTVNTIQV